MNGITLSIDDLFLNHRQALIHIIQRIVGCPQTAEDLAHETYLKMVQAAKTQTINYPHPFLYQIARNLALDYLRKEKLRQQSGPSANDDDNDQLLASVPSNEPTPEQQTLDRQQVDMMFNALNGLSERRRQILVLHKFHHWTYERIARHFGISRSAVEKNVHAALAHLLAARSGQTN